MEEYPEELRTPPLPLVALVGMPELHIQVTHYLRAEQPPLATVSIAEATGAGILAGKEKRPPDAKQPQPSGILKADWLAKHRQRAAGVAVIFLHRDTVLGDPSQYMAACTQVDTVKVGGKARGVKLVIALVQNSNSAADISEERVIALRRRAETDSRHVVPFVVADVAELRKALGRLAAVVGELAATFYRDEGRRVKLRLERKLGLWPELAVRYNFKVAVYAEFRRDWASALKFYNTAYTLLREVPTSMGDIQPVLHLTELKSVAEILHVKLSTLLLHSGNTLEAVAQLRRHIGWYKPLTGPPGGVFLHWAWISKQFQVFGELLQSRAAAGEEKDREQHPAFYFQVAADCAVRRRRTFEAALATAEAFGDLDSPDVLSGPLEGFAPPAFVGQPPRILARGVAPDQQRPTEQEFLRHALLREKEVGHAMVAIGLLTKAHEEYKKLQFTGRMIYQLGDAMAREYLAAGDYANARRLFDSVAAMYRREAWAALLASALSHLRECARKLALLPEFLEYSLELAALPLPQYPWLGGHQIDSSTPSPHLDQRKLCQLEAFSILSNYAPPKACPPIIGGGATILSSTAGEDPEAKETSIPEREMVVEAVNPIQLMVTEGTNLRGVITATVSFHKRTAQPGETIGLTLGLISRLPGGITPLDVEVTFSDPNCNLQLLSSTQAGPPPNLMDDLTPEAPAGTSRKLITDLELKPLEWNRTTLEVTPSTSGRLECLGVILRFGPHASLRCQVDVPPIAGGEVLVPFWCYEPRGGGAPITSTTVGMAGLKVLEVGESPAQLDILVDSAGEPALVGELLPIRITLISRGDHLSNAHIKLTLGGSDSETGGVPAEFVNPEQTPESSTLANRSLRLEQAEWGNFQGAVQVPDFEAGGKFQTLVFVRFSASGDCGLGVAVAYETAEGGGEGGGESPKRQVQVRKVIPLRCESPFSLTHHWVGPFRQEALLPPPGPPSTPLPRLALGDSNLLAITLKNTASISLSLLKLTLESPSESTSQAIEKPTREALASGEEFTKLFRVGGGKGGLLSVGSVAATWQREVQRVAMVLSFEEGSLEGPEWPPKPLEVVTRLEVPEVAVDSPSLVATINCPPFASLGQPFGFSITLKNHTFMLQEVSYSVVDAPGFVLGGSHNGQTAVLPRASQTLTYRMVPIQSGMVHLPQIKITALRYGARFQLASHTARLFVYPTHVHGERKETGSPVAPMAALSLLDEPWSPPPNDQTRVQV